MPSVRTISTATSEGTIITTTTLEIQKLDAEAEALRTNILNAMCPIVVKRANEQKWTPELRQLVIEYVESLTATNFHDGNGEAPADLKNT